MAIKNDVAADIASELASLQAEQGSATESEEAAPEGDSVETDPEASEELEETETEDEDEADLDEDLDSADAGDAEAFKSEIADLIDSGDLKAAAEKLGLDPSIFKLNNRQFKASRTAVKEAKAAKTEAETKAAEALQAQRQAEQLNTKAEEIYGPVVAGKHHYKNGNVLEARAALELMFDDTYENIVRNMAAGAKAMNPAELEVRKLRKELQDEKAAKAAETATQTAAQADATEVAGIAAKLKGTPLEALSDEAAVDIQKVMRASYNKALGKYTKTLKEAYAEVKAGYAAKAEKLATVTGKKPAPKAKDKREPLERTKLAPKVPTGKKLTAEQEFAAELAAAKKETQAAARRDQRRAR